MKPLTDAIEHIVVLMFENRSFDNVLGGLYPEKTAAGQFRGLTGKETNSILDPTTLATKTFGVFQSSASDPKTFVMPDPDPGELFTDMNEQILGPGASLQPMTGFASSYAKQICMKDACPKPLDIMQYYSSETMPVSHFMAKTFAVCDTWFASGPVQTIANRIFAHCGTPGLKAGTNDARIDNPDFMAGILTHLSPPVKDLTVFEALDRQFPHTGGTHNWKVYYHDAPLSALCEYVFDNWISGKVHSYDRKSLFGKTFQEDVAGGTLPKYSFIEPRYSDVFGGTANSNHPGGAGIDIKDPNGSSLPPAIDVRPGEQLLREVYETLRANPDVFAKTLLIVTYDEHGGLYDHLPPPKAVSPFSKPVDNFPYNRYGVRVPTIFISPRIAEGTIYPPRTGPEPVWSPTEFAVPTPHDHTSLIQTVLQQFGATGEFGPRTAQAPPVSGLIGHEVRLAPPCPPVDYTPPRPVDRPHVTTFQPLAPTLHGALGALYHYIQNRAQPLP